METNSKAEKIRYVMTVITMTLAFMMICLCIIGLQVKVINVDYFGTKMQIKTLCSNVQSFLLNNNIYIDDNTILYPSLNYELSSGDTITIDSKIETAKIDINSLLADYRPTQAKIIEEEVVIAKQEEYIENASIYRGVSIVKNEGKDGKKKVKYILKSDGNTEEKVILDEVVLEVAENKVTEVGTSFSATARGSGVVIPAVDSGFRIYNIPLPADMQQYTYAMCQKYNLQYEMLLAVMSVESNFQINCVGGNNSYGLCQIHYSNTSMLQNAIGITDLLDPYDNIEAGAYMLNTYLNAARKRSSDTYVIEHYGLNCYNMGEGVFVKNCYNNGILERTYSNKVLTRRNNLLNTGTV